MNSTHPLTPGVLSQNALFQGLIEVLLQKNVLTKEDAKKMAAYAIQNLENVSSSDSQFEELCLEAIKLIKSTPFFSE